MSLSKEGTNMQTKTCKICGRRVARYICQECGRQVCQFCFEPSTWFCSDCHERLKREAPVLQSLPWSTPFKLFLLGFTLTFLGMVVIMIATIFFGSSTSAGVVIWILPLPPIGFGAGPFAFWAVLLVVALAILSLVLFIALLRRIQ